MQSERIQACIFVENINYFKIVFVSQSFIVHIVRRSYFQATGSEFNIYIFVFNNRNHSSCNWNDRFFAFQMRETLVIWIDTDGSIPKNSFRTRCCNRQEI
ncbi:hypothetical protein D3C80_1426100 [compost metagenome]